MRHFELRRGVWIAILIAAIALVANAAVLVARTYPARRALVEARAARDAAESELHAARQELRSMRVLGGEALDAGDDLRAFLANRVEPAASVPEVLAHLRAAADQAGVSLESIDYSAEPVDALGLISLAMSVRGAASYGAVRSWIGAIRRGPGMVFVDGVEMTGSGGSLLSVELTAVAVLRAEGETAP